MKLKQKQQNIYHDKKEREFIGVFYMLLILFAQTYKINRIDTLPNHIYVVFFGIGSWTKKMCLLN